MSSATSPDTQIVDTKIDEFDARFVDSFEKASERRLRVLYDHVAPKLSDQFEQLATAGEDQVEVLNSVAKLVGLEELDVRKPLADDANEALAQRITWRSAARWAILSLLWALVEYRPEAMAAGDWAIARKKPRSGSSLPSGDESLARDVAAASLTTSFAATNGAGLVVLDLPVVISPRDDGRIAANAVRPVGLVETGSDRSSNPIELTTGDRIWLAGSEGGFFSLEAEYETAGPLDLEITSGGQLKLDAQTRAVGVVQGFTLLYEGDPVEQSS